MFRDLRLLRDRGEADGLFCEWQPTESGVQQQLYVDVYYEPAAAPDDTFLLRGTSARPVVTDLTYVEYVQYFDSVIESYRPAGYDSYVKPWFDVWLPDSSVEAYVEEMVSTLKHDDWSKTSRALLFVHRRAAMTRPCFRVPDRTDWVYLFDILNDSGTPGPNPAFLERMLTRNDTFWAKAKLLGGTRYPIGALRFTNEDWVEHYGPTWSAFRDWKRRFDPERILTPGPGIFS
jgi:FAD/FMN-containing dehydrogenase